MSNPLDNAMSRAGMKVELENFKDNMPLYSEYVVLLTRLHSLYWKSLVESGAPEEVAAQIAAANPPFDVGGKK